MDPRTLVFSIAMAIMAALGIPFLAAIRRARSSQSEAAQDWSLSRLLLASFLTLFAELALIRWVAVEVRVFAYFKNLALLLCFTGFGLGCALARRTTRVAGGMVALLGLVTIVRLPFGGKWLEGLSQSLGAAGDAEIWATGTSW